jgi:hypothetical protein
MTEMGHKEKSPFVGLCQLPPAADMPPPKATCKKCEEATYGTRDLGCRARQFEWSTLIDGCRRLAS